MSSEILTLLWQEFSYRQPFFYLKYDPPFVQTAGACRFDSSSPLLQPETQKTAASLPRFTLLAPNEGWSLPPYPTASLFHHSPTLSFL
jgi:hypothetical protein